ncbi:hypothetical protein Verru16b_02689 [Lacunisphaera limnophila]|uniref:Uncharacterized protein n=1 Tax=Lacunisphaera limnophila TaxID=1838286 RepID=A0A1D8AXJ3_9BACT|nr:hypothetical protein [Lacunisphaera limnophila]AOS45606.1 hypothetical protein Verru16b_02689 [Lacunisphaera limnophila]
MKTNLTPAGTCRLEIRVSERETFTEYHVTASPESPVAAGPAAEQLFAAVAAALVEHRIQPVQEKIYGLTAVREEVLRQRDSIYRLRGLDRTMPVTWIEGTPLHAGGFAGVQIWGVASRDGQACVSTVENDVTGRARLWTGAGFRMLHLPAVRGTRPGGALAPSRLEQAAQMFANVGAGLAAHGMKYTQVKRTWIYLAQLLEWYLDMNRVRTDHYRRHGLGWKAGRTFRPAPASWAGAMGKNV